MEGKYFLEYIFKKKIGVDFDKESSELMKRRGNELERISNKHGMELCDLSLPVYSNRIMIARNVGGNLGDLEMTHSLSCILDTTTLFVPENNECSGLIRNLESFYGYLPKPRLTDGDRNFVLERKIKLSSGKIIDLGRITKTREEVNSALGRAYDKVMKG